MKMDHVKIISDGTGIGTHVMIAGREIAARAIKIDFPSGDHAHVLLELAVDEVEIVGSIDVEFTPTGLAVKP